ncbi:MAG TPA: helix-turn-helix domain-containing protein [Nocardioidaceae bacterium]|nr:helix-turn-helix domain-containing protein [Nocardioidaceae bacterium]
MRGHVLKQPRESHRVAVVVPDDLPIFELGIAAKVFALPVPPHEGPWYDVQVCAARPRLVRAAGGILAVSIRHGPEAIEGADTVVVTRADSLDRPADEAVLGAVRRAYSRGGRVASFGTGAFVLAAAGVLDGRPATTHSHHVRRLAVSYTDVKVAADARLVDDGQVLTSAEGVAAIDLSLHIIRQDHGDRVVRDVARRLGVASPDADRRPRLDPLAAEPFDPAVRPDGVLRAMDYAMGHLGDDLTAVDLARYAFMSPRNFSRRFRDVVGTSPARWLAGQRLARARELLEKTDLPVERVAEAAGFGSAVALRHRFSRAQAVTPAAYRRAARIGEHVGGGPGTAT